MNNKLKRINEDIKRVISKIILQEMRNKNFKYVTITDVVTNSDLSISKIYFTCLDDKELVIKSLNKNKNIIKLKLSKELKLRKMPDLVFIYDDLIDYEYHIEDKIKNVMKEEN